MRATQWIGLNEDAIKFLLDNGERVKLCKCPTCSHEHGGELIKAKYDDAEGMYWDKYPLFSYPLTDGRVAKEVVDAVPWSSGPVIFLCLEIDGVRDFQWPQDIIDNA